MPVESYQAHTDNGSVIVEDDQYHDLNIVAQSPLNSEGTDVKSFSSESDVSSIMKDTSSAALVTPISRSPPVYISDSFVKDVLGLENPKDAHLLRHFTRVVSRSLSLAQDDEANPFLSLIVPLAGTSKVVMEAILALSAGHLRRIYPNVLQRGLLHQNAGKDICIYEIWFIDSVYPALKSLNDIISMNSSASSEEALAAILLLCMIEICDGNSTKWAWHISAAQAIIRSKQRSQQTSTWRFLLAIFGYVDSVITISKCQPPLITLQELADDEGDEVDYPGILERRHLPSASSYNEALFGVGK